MTSTTTRIVEGLSLWQSLVYPALSLILAAAAIYVGAIPVRRSHRAKQNEKESQIELERLRTSAANNAVLGLEVNPNVGRFNRIPGLVDDVSDIFQSQQRVNTVVHEIREEQASVATALEKQTEALKEHRSSLTTSLDTLANRVGEHIAQDDRRFDEVIAEVKNGHNSNG
jgi:hypothetical protein